MILTFRKETKADKRRSLHFSINQIFFAVPRCLRLPCLKHGVMLIFASLFPFSPCLFARITRFFSRKGQKFQTEIKDVVSKDFQKYTLF